MGFFRKKKNETSSSVLSESEIHKKLYGEFSDRTSRVVIGDREHFKEPVLAPLRSKESSQENDSPIDLFSAQKEALAEPELSSRQISSEQRPADHASRYVPLHDFEKKPIVTAPVSYGSDSYARFRYNRPQEKKLVSFLALCKGFSEKMGELFNFFLDAKQVALRRIFYWGAAGLVVFILFWGVNALNSQREEALRIRYKISGKPIAVKVPEVAVAAVSVKPAVERPVVITPAPIRSSKRAPANDSYVIQVVTYPSAQEADAIVKNLKNAGFRAFAKENARPSGRVFYVVLVGGFRSAAEAQSQLSKLRGQEVARHFQDAYVRTNRS